MTKQCKFGIENYPFTRSVVDTCIPVMECVKLSRLQNHRPHRKRTKYSIEWRKREGRACRSGAKTAMEIPENGYLASTSPVSCRWHVRKAMWSKLGDLVPYVNMPGRS